MYCVEDVSKLLEQLVAETIACREQLNAIRGAMTASRMREVIRFTEEHQMSFEETLVSLAESSRSFARFGDGEFRLISDPGYHLGFQRNSRELRLALGEVLRAGGSESLLLGWPRPFRTLHNTNVWTIVWDDIYDLVPAGARFGNSHVSRPVFFAELGHRGVDLWRRVWEDVDVTIVTGEGSRFELIPELFDNVRSHRFVYSSPKNAFDDIDGVCARVLGLGPTGLVLISLGPAGTVLASRLSSCGVRALDVGHLSGSYMNVFEGRGKPERQPYGK